MEVFLIHIAYVPFDGHTNNQKKAYSYKRGRLYDSLLLLEHTKVGMYHYRHE